MRPPADGHRWLAIEDPEHDATWMFDLTFLLSSYECIYGRGCQSISPDPETGDEYGCCVHGAHMVNEEDLEQVTNYIGQLTPDEWQYHGRAKAKGGALKKNKSGDWVTRKAEGACIMLNRSDFPNGAGCALHQGAVARGERPLDWKPDVCWQVPLHLDILTNDYEHETILVRGWNRRDWGPGGEDFHWWCIEDDKAYQAASPVYITSRDELIEMVGSDIYDRFVDAIAAGQQNGTPVFLDERRGGDRSLRR